MYNALKSPEKPGFEKSGVEKSGVGKFLQACKKQLTITTVIKRSLQDYSQLNYAIIFMSDFTSCS